MIRTRRSLELLWTGLRSLLIAAADDQRIELISSQALIDELHDVLQRPKFVRRLDARNLSGEAIVDVYTALVRIVTPVDIQPTIIREPADDVVLSTAVAANADLIVSGDRDLLDVANFSGIAIVTAAQALARIALSETGSISFLFAA